jgi:hypothetical protein
VTQWEGISTTEEAIFSEGDLPFASHTRTEPDSPKTPGTTPPSITASDPQGSTSRISWDNAEKDLPHLRRKLVLRMVPVALPRSGKGRPPEATSTSLGKHLPADRPLVVGFVGGTDWNLYGELVGFSITSAHKKAPLPVVRAPSGWQGAKGMPTRGAPHQNK